VDNLAVLERFFRRSRLLGAWPHSGRSRAHRRRLELAMSLLRERAPA